jgi:ATP-dependent DNA ligase
MSLPLHSSYAPMNALLVDEVPDGERWHYEPKWDGFRCLAFCDGGRIELRSKSGQPLARYFPEIVAELSRLKVKRFVLDGELVVPLDGGLSFDALLQRIHPAESRIRKLALETPAMFIVFDLLVDASGRRRTDQPLARRREALEEFAVRVLHATDRLVLSPTTRDRRTALRWFGGVGSGSAVDGIIGCCWACTTRTDCSITSGSAPRLTRHFARRCDHYSSR